MATLKTNWVDGDILTAGTIVSTSSMNGITTTVNSNTITSMMPTPFVIIPYPCTTVHWGVLTAANGWTVTTDMLYSMTRFYCQSATESAYIAKGRLSFAKDQYFRTCFYGDDLGGTSWFWAGLGDGTKAGHDQSAAFVWIVEGSQKLYAHTGSGAAETNVDITGSLTQQVKHLYEIIFTSGVSAVFKVDGVILATVTTTLPTTVPTTADVSYSFTENEGVPKVLFVLETWVASEL